MSTIQTNTVDSSLLTTMNGKTTASTSVQSAQNQFMTLLTTQMKNQDPLNPMDNAQVTSQLAQLSTVTGINQLNASVNSLNSNFQASQNLQSANMIGHGVLAPGNTLNLASGKAVYGVTMPQNVSNASVAVTDASGAVVRTIALGAVAQGTNSMSWDGKTDSGATAPDGNYTFNVSATNNGVTVAPTNLEFGMVASVSSSAQGVKLNLASNMGAINVSDVVQIY